MNLFAALAAFLIGLPAVAAGQQRCPWLNPATAAGVLGGAVQTTVTASSCEFVRRAGPQEALLRIEVTAANLPHAHCPPGAEALKSIGNEAVACAYKEKAGWVAEQVVGRVRDQAFLVRIAVNDRSAGDATLRRKARDIAEQVAGILF